MEFEPTEDPVLSGDISHGIEMETKAKQKSNVKWNYNMELEMVKAILKHKAHIVTITEKGVKWDQVHESLKNNPVFKKVFSEHEVRFVNL